MAFICASVTFVCAILATVAIALLHWPRRPLALWGVALLLSGFSTQAQASTSVIPDFPGLNAANEIGIGEPMTLRLRFLNPLSTQNTAMGFDIPLPAGMELVPDAGSPSGYAIPTTTCNVDGGTPVFDTSDPARLVMSGGSNPPDNTGCEILASVRMLESGAVDFVFPALALTETNDTNTVISPPSNAITSFVAIYQDFSVSLSETFPDWAKGYATGQATLTFTNPNALDLTNLSFVTDDPADAYRFNPAVADMTRVGDVIVSDSCNPSFDPNSTDFSMFSTVPATGIYTERSVLNYSGGVIPAQGSCQIVFNMTTAIVPDDGYVASSGGILRLDAADITVDNAGVLGSTTLRTAGGDQFARNRIAAGVLVWFNAAGSDNNATQTVSISGPGSAFELHLVVENFNIQEYNSAALTATLPAAAAGNIKLTGVASNSCGGTVALSESVNSDGFDDTITLSGATFSAADPGNVGRVGTQCEVVVAATADAEAEYLGFSSHLDAGSPELVPGVSFSARSASLIIQEVQVFDVAMQMTSPFTSNSGASLAIYPGEEVAMEYTISNLTDASSGVDYSNVSIVDKLFDVSEQAANLDPSGQFFLLDASTYQTTCGGTPSFTRLDDETFKVTGLDVPRGSQCTVTVPTYALNLQGINQMAYLNVKTDINNTDQEGATWQIAGSPTVYAHADREETRIASRGSMNLDLRVSGPTPDTLVPGQSATWEIDLRIGRFDDLPREHARAMIDLTNGLTLASPFNASTDCPDGIVSGFAGGTVVALSGATFPSGMQNCRLSFDVVAGPTLGTAQQLDVTDLDTPGSPYSSYNVAAVVPQVEALFNPANVSNGSVIDPLAAHPYAVASEGRIRNGTLLTVVDSINFTATPGFNPASTTPGKAVAFELLVENNEAFDFTDVSFAYDLDSTDNTNQRKLTSLRVSENANARVSDVVGSGCGLGTVTIDPDDKGFRFDGAVVPAGAQCLFAINVLSTVGTQQTLGVDAGGVTSATGSNTNSALQTLAVSNGVGVDVTFVPDVLAPGEEGELIITILNGTNADQPLDQDFSVTLNGGADIDTGRAVTDACEVSGDIGTVTTDTSSPPHSVTLAASPPVTLPSGELCVIRVPIVAPLTGSATVVVPQGELSAGGFDNAEESNTGLVVANPPTVALAVAAARVDVTENTTLIWTLNNNNAPPSEFTEPHTGANFAVTLPANVVVSDPLTLGGTCGNVTSDAVAGGGSFNITGGTIPPLDGSCTITMDVSGTSKGEYTVSASGVDTEQANNPGAAPAPVSFEFMQLVVEGVLFLDSNEDGIYDAVTESAAADYSGVVVNLIDQGTTTILDTTQTLADGSYRFDVLYSATAAGLTYAVQVPDAAAGLPGNPVVRTAADTINNLAFDVDNGLDTLSDQNFAFTVQPDYSDAPITGTAPDGLGTVSYGDALHDGSSLRLGATLTVEDSSLASAEADGDGASDDGVVVPVLSAGDTTDLVIPAADITGNGSGTLYAWIDFDGNGAFDADEFASTPFNNGASADLVFSNYGFVMFSAPVGRTFARFRLTSDALGANDAAVAATDGEVEDYAVSITGLISPLNYACGAMLGVAQQSGLTDSYFFELDTSNGTRSAPVQLTYFQPGDANHTAPVFVDGLAHHPGTGMVYAFVLDDLDPSALQFDPAAVATLGVRSQLVRLGSTGEAIPVDAANWLDNRYLAGAGFDENGNLYAFDVESGEILEISTTTGTVTRTALTLSPVPSGLSNGTVDLAMFGGGYGALLGDGLSGVGFNVVTGETSSGVIPGTLSGFDSGSIAVHGLAVAPSLQTGQVCRLNVLDSNAADELGFVDDPFSQNAPLFSRLGSFSGTPDGGAGDLASCTFMPCLSDRGDAGFGDAVAHALDNAGAGLRLGSSVDFDWLSQASAAANGDDNDGRDDDDGIVVPVLTADETADVVIAAADISGSGVGTLYAWIDFDGSGSFDADEYASVAFNNGALADLVFSNYGTTRGEGATTARFRLTTATLGASDAATLAPDGEVEDYEVTVELGGFTVSGRVFDDRNVNGSLDSGEAGLGGVSVILHDTVANSCSSVRSGADGTFRFTVVPPGNYTLYEAANETFPLPAACPPTEQDPNGYISTLNNRSFVISTADVAGQDFANVREPSLLDEHTSSVAAGSGVAYPHRFTAYSSGTATFSLTDTADPANLDWGESLYRDSNCDGLFDEGDVLLNAPLALNAGDQICLLAAAFAPASAAAGAVHVLNLHSTFSYGTGSSGLADNTQMRSNISTTTGSPSQPAGTGVLELTLGVFNVTRGISGEQALPGETLRYTITYSNVGNGALNTLVIRNPLPAFTQLVGGSQRCDAANTPAGLSSCSIDSTGDLLSWTWPAADELPAGASGQVSFEVVVE